MPNDRKIFTVLFLIAFIVLPLATFAIGGCRNLEVQLPGLTSTCLPALPDYIAAIYNFALIAIGILVFVALIYGGFRYLTSAGNPTAMSDATDQISSALLGLVILFSAWLILNTINPELLFLGEPPKYEQKCLYNNDCPVQTCTSGKCSQTGVGCINATDCSPFSCEAGLCVEKPAIITIYEDSDYSGNSLNISNSTADLTSVNWATAAVSVNEKISSIKIHDPQYAVILFENTNFNNGGIQLIEQDTSRLGDMNDKTSSYKIIRKESGSGKATLYDSPNYVATDSNGNDTCSAFDFYYSNQNFAGLSCKDTNFDNRASSIDVNFGAIAILYKDFDFQGYAGFFDQSNPDLGPLGLGNNASSIKIINGFAQ